MTKITIDKKRLLDALNAVSIALNTVPRTQINHPTLRNTYDVASLVEKLIQEVEGQ